MTIEEVIINGKKISDFKITCDKSNVCPWIAKPSDTYDMHSLVRDYCSKEGFGCKTKYRLIQKEIIGGE